MVDSFAQSITLDIRGGGYTFSPKDIIDGMKLSWGRSSIFDEPSKRSLSASLLVDYAMAQALTAGGRHVLGERIKFLQGSTVLFRGSVDTIEAEPAPGGKVRLNLHSVEATTWNFELNKTFTTRAATASLLTASLKIQTGLPDVTIGDPVDGKTKFKQPENQVEVTVLQAYNALVSARPLARPIWKPDLSEVWPSFYNMQGIWYDSTFSADKVAADTWEMNEAEQPLWVEMHTGGLFGESSQTAKFPVSGPGAGTRKVENEWGVQAYNDWEIEGVKTILAAQSTAPRKFTVAARDVPNSWMMPWETSRRFKFDPTTLTGNDFYQRWEKDQAKRYVPIGGTIVVKHGLSTHEMTCVYG